MKRLLAMLLLLSIGLALGGCGLTLGARPVDPGLLETKPTASLTEPDIPETKPTESQAPTTETPTEPPIPQVTVSDAYVDTLYYGETLCCYHIPQFDMDSAQTESLNRAIYLELYELLEENVYEYPEQPFLFCMNYSWVQVENIVSLLVYAQGDWGIEVYRVYHAYADGSGVVSREELLEFLGYTREDFYAMVQTKLEDYYRTSYSSYPGSETDEYYRMQLQNTISYENATKVLPYLSVNGELCCVATIYSLAGADSYDHLVNLEGGEAPVPSCSVHS
ncbi:MAG: hypothetical protein IJA48_05605 [Oscillospiraceae bacterium]|nr:hypothetical protein [Oscillospiraceae bacterium]